MRVKLIIAAAALTLATAFAGRPRAEAQTPQRCATWEPGACSRAGVRVGVITDRTTYAAGAAVTFHVSVTNVTAAPIMLSFASGNCIIRLAVRDGAGVEVARIVADLLGNIVPSLSGGPVCTRDIATLSLAPAETRIVAVVWDQHRISVEEAEQRVAPGDYRVYAEVGGVESGPATFSIEPPQTVDIPGRVSLEPGRTVTFRRASDGASLTVIGATLTIGVALTDAMPPNEPPLSVPSIVFGEAMGLPSPPSCSGANTAVVGETLTNSCAVQPGGPNARLTFTVTPCRGGPLCPIACPPGTRPEAIGRCTPIPVRMATIPGSAELQSGESVTFRRAADGATLSVRLNYDTIRRTVSYDGSTLTIDPPYSGECWIAPATAFASWRRCGASGVSQVRADATSEGIRIELIPAPPQPICPDTGQPAPVVAPGQIGPCPSLSVGPNPPGVARTILPVSACSNVALTFTDDTPVARVERAVRPGGALEAVWRWDAARQRFLGWSPVPDAPNDFITVNRLDTVFLCIRGEAVLDQPDPR